VNYRTIYFTFLALIIQNFSGLDGKEYLIQSINVKENRLEIIPNTDFKKSYLTENFFAIYGNDIQLNQLNDSILSIPFVLSVISLVWESGQEYYIEEMDQELYYSLQKIKEVYKVFYRSVDWSGELIPDHLVKNELVEEKEELITLPFSGGLDSVCTSYSHYPTKQILITYFGFSTEIWPELQDIVRDQCFEFGQTLNYVNTFVESNFRTLINYDFLYSRHPEMKPWYVFCQESLSLAALAAPILILNNCHNFQISSSMDWSFRYPFGTHPFIDNNIRFSDVKVNCFSFDLTRQDKIKKIIEVSIEKELPLPKLHVCRHLSGRSCCRCIEKCMVTINGLVAEGEDPADYGFKRSFESVMKNTQKKFKKGKKIQRFYEGACGYWQSVQNRILEKGLPSQNRDYWQWFVEVDFPSFIIHPNCYSGKEIDYDQYRYLLDE